MTPATDKRKRAQRQGKRAEVIAAMWLRAKGYRLLAHGARLPGGEIDLIAKRGRVVVFVEVKRRLELADALHAVSHNQQRRIQHAAEAFMAHTPSLQGHDWRFDVIVIRPWRLPQHLIDAWRPSLA